jgi:hypothetical protein
MKLACAWLAILLLSIPVTAAAVESVKPKALLIYYSYPSLINGSSTVAEAAAELGDYDYVVLGDLLEKSTHPDHLNTVAIIADPAMASTTVFGYIDLGVTTEDLPLSEIQSRIDDWQATGARGIFFDLFGYDFGTDRTRQNAAVDYAHSKGLPVVANAFIPADAFGDEVNAYNPTGTPTSLNASDYYLYESYQVILGQFDTEPNWLAKSNALQGFQNTIGFNILSVTTSDVTTPYEQSMFFYVWYSALLYGHEATGWGEYNYSAWSASAPFRARPSVEPGVSFTSGVTDASPLFSRNTNLGTVSVDTATHVSGFSSLPVSDFAPGGRTRNDCTLEWFTTPVPPLGAHGVRAARLDCTDDDPACDFGSAGDAACTFHVAVCLNVMETRFTCAPTDIAQVQVQQPTAAQRHAWNVTNRAALQGALAGLGAHVQGLCTNRGAHHGEACQASSDCDSAPGRGDGWCRTVTLFAPPLSTTDQCTAFAAISAPLRQTARGPTTRRLTLQLKATPSNDPLSGGPRHSDSDRLTLVCHPHS